MKIGDSYNDLVRGCNKTKNWLGTTMEALNLIADGTQRGFLSVEGITVRRCNQLLLQCSKLSCGKVYKKGGRKPKKNRKKQQNLRKFELELVPESISKSASKLHNTSNTLKK